MPVDNDRDPRKDLQLLHQQRRSTNTFGSIASPLEDEVKDIERIALLFANFPFVPFFDNSDSTLRTLRLLSSLSPTHGSCISNKQNYVTGGGLRAVQPVRPGASYARAEYLGKEQEAAVFDFIESWHPECNLQYFMEQVNSIFLNYEVFGNAFLRVTISKVGGAASIYYENIDAEKVRYLAIKDSTQRYVGIAALWEYEYLSRHPPELVSVYPNFDTLEDGTMTTVIHVKNKSVGRDYYGLPSSYQSVFYQYLEYQLGDYGTKGYANQWTGKVFLETAGDNIDDGDTRDFVQNMRDVFSAGGKSRNLLHRHRNEADPQTLVHEFKDSKTHEFHTGMAEISERQIIKSHDWSAILMGVLVPGRLGGQSDFADIYQTKYYSVIVPLQDKTMNPFNELYKIASKHIAGAVEASVALQNLIEQESLEQGTRNNEAV